MQQTLSGSPLAQAAALALLHFLWQGVLLAMLLGAALSVLPRSLARLRYAACAATLASMLVAPLVTLATLLVPLHHGPLIERVGAPPVIAFSSPVLCIWGAGCATMLLRLLLGLARAQRLVRRATPVAEAWQQRLSALGERVGLRRPVRLLTSDEVDSPVLVGAWRPVVLVPLSALTALPAAYLEALLVHELGHVRRLDFLVNVLQSCVEAVLFYHPAVHWVSASMRREREFCCDDVAVSITGDRLGYARALASMEGLRARMPEPVLAARGGPLLTRVERVLGARARRPRWARSTIAVAALLCVCATAIGACSQASTTREDAVSIAWLPSAVQRWSPQLSLAAEQHRVDPNLLAIVTLAESLGDPAAVSPAGSIGLMQLMPSTAARIAATRRLDGYAEQRLQDPAYNIDFGAWYIADQLAAIGAAEARGAELDQRSVELVAVAYNGGEKMMQAYRDAGTPLPEPVRAYRDLIVGMWNERALPESATYGTWRSHLGL